LITINKSLEKSVEISEEEKIEEEKIEEEKIEEEKIKEGEKEPDGKGKKPV